MVKTMKTVRKAWTNQKGESLGEVLVAVLVIALGAVILASMLTASFHIMRISSSGFRENMAVKNAVESDAASSSIESELSVSGGLYKISVSEDGSTSTAQIPVKDDSNRIKINLQKIDGAKGGIYNYSPVSQSGN